MANNETDTKQKAESDRLAKIAAENEEQRKLSEDAIKAATPKPTESESEPESTPKEEAKTAPQNSIFRAKIEPGDDPMVAMMKEWLNMMIDKYDGNLEGAAWNQVKDIFKAVKNYLTDQDSPSEQQTNTSTPKPTPTPLTEEQIEAYKVLGLNENKLVDPQVVNLATTLKIDELDKKMSGCNDQIQALGDKQSADYEQLAKDNENQQPPMSREEYLEKHKAIHDQYLSDYNNVIREFDSHASQRADCLMARDVLLNKPTFDAGDTLLNQETSTIKPDQSNIAQEDPNIFEQPGNEENVQMVESDQEIQTQNDRSDGNPEYEPQGYDDTNYVELGKKVDEGARVVEEKERMKSDASSSQEKKWEANQKDPAYLNQRAAKLGDFIAKDQAALDAMDKKYQMNPSQTPQRDRQELVARILDSQERLADVNRRLDTLQNEPTAVNKEQEGKQRDGVEITPLTDTSPPPPMDITEKEKDQSVVMTASTDASITPTMDNAEKGQDKDIAMTASTDSSTTPGNNIPEKEFSNPQQNPQVTTAPDTTNKIEPGHQPITPGM